MSAPFHKVFCTHYLASICGIVPYGIGDKVVIPGNCGTLVALLCDHGERKHRESDHAGHLYESNLPIEFTKQDAG